MKTRFNRTSLLAALMCLCTWATGHANVTFHWGFDPTNYVVSPTERVTIYATLFNDASSSGQLTPLGVGARFVGDTAAWPYWFSFNDFPKTFGDQFANLSLAPGQEFHFVWGYMTPVDGEAPIGIYPAWKDAGLGFGGGYNNDETRNSDDTFQITVVPEPTVAGFVACMGITLLGLMVNKSKNRERRRAVAVAIGALRGPGWVRIQSPHHLQIFDQN